MIRLLNHLTLVIVKRNLKKKAFIMIHYKGFIPILVCTKRIYMNILFVRLSYIGDILHATPAARWIKEHYSEAKLHWIVTPSMVELLKNNPYVDEIIPWERDEYEAHSKKTTYSNDVAHVVET